MWEISESFGITPPPENYSDKGKENQVVEQGGWMPVNGKKKMYKGCLQLMPTDVEEEYLKMKHILCEMYKISTH